MRRPRLTACKSPRLFLPLAGLLLCALIVLLVSGSIAWADDPFFFIQMTDPQLGMATRDHGFARESASFEAAIAAANRLKPAFVIVTGDLTNRPGDPAEAEEYWRIAGKLDGAIPLYNVAGNHDVGNKPTPRSLEVYNSRYGPDYYRFRAGSDGGFVGFVINTSLARQPGDAPDAARRAADVVPGGTAPGSSGTSPAHRGVPAPSGVRKNDG